VPVPGGLGAEVAFDLDAKRLFGEVEELGHLIQDALGVVGAERDLAVEADAVPGDWKSRVIDTRPRVCTQFARKPPNGPLRPSSPRSSLC
jgi:hypothetical protein